MFSDKFARRLRMGIHLTEAHYQLTRLAIALGPDNPITRLQLRRSCGKYGVTAEFASDAVEIVKGDRVIRISPKN